MDVLAMHMFLLRSPHLFTDPPAEEEWPVVGQEFLGYYLMEQLGTGGLARVFLAIDLGRGATQVVVKISHCGQLESFILGPLDHPNIISVGSPKIDERTGLTALEMPYYGKATLETVLTQLFSNESTTGRPRLTDALLQAVADETASESNAPAWFGELRYVDGLRQIFAQLADALIYLHSHGIVHRDLKPANILIKPDGTPVLVDFNVSKDSLWGDHGLGGTLRYMSPEQARAAAHLDNTDPSDTAIAPPVGKETEHIPKEAAELAACLSQSMTQADPRFGPAAEIDHRSDLYSLAVVFYELMTGRHPFGPLPVNLPLPEQRAYLLEQQRHFGPERVQQDCPDADPGLCRLIAECLAWDPKQRPDSAADVARRLRKTPVRQRVRRWTLMHPVLTRVAGVLFAIVLLATVAFAAKAYFLPLPKVLTPLDRGRQLYQAGQYQKAVEQLTTTIGADTPETIDALLLRARARKQLGRQAQKRADRQKLFVAALVDFLEVEKTQPTGQISASLGYLYQRLRKTHEADLAYQQAILRNYVNAALLNNHGRVQSQRGYHKQALESLDAAIRRERKLQAAYHNRAVVHLRLHLQYALSSRSFNKHLPLMEHHLVKARDDITKAVKLGPPKGELYWHAALIFAEVSKRDPPLTAVALDHARSAVLHGARANDFYISTSFRHLITDPRFLGLATFPRGTAHSAMAVRILDPVR